MDMQNVSNLQTPEGAVRTIHDKDNRLIWGRLNYDTKYAGDTVQDGTPTPDAPIPVQVVTGEQTVTVSGANLYDYTDTKSVSTGVTADSDGWITAAYNNTGGSTVYLQYFTDLLPLENNTNYAIAIEVKNVSGNGALDVCTSYQGQFTSSDNYLFSQLEGGKAYIRTETTKASFDGSIYSLRTVINFASGQSGSITFRISVLEDTTVVPESFVYQSYQSQSYSISLGSTELCKIGDYQDYIYKSGDDWYVHKETKSFNLVDTTNWGRNANGRFYSTGWATDNGFEVAPGLCTHLIYSTTPWYGDGYFGITSSGNLWIDTGNAAITSGAEMNAWLATKLPVVYGVLKHTTDTRITDDTLIGQLNDVHEWLTRYGYSSTVAGNLPIIIDKTSL